MDQTRNFQNTAFAMRAVLALLLVIPLACTPRDPSEPRVFASPEAAAEAMIEALEHGDAEALLDVVGHRYREQYVSDDWDAEAEARHRIASAARETLVLEDSGDSRVMVIGEDEWPMPIPIVAVEDGWAFDGEAGSEEVVNRRIGRNELAAIALANAYVDAQIEYALEDRNGNGALEYAQRLASQPGTRDGLYWPDEPGQEQSPFGPLVARVEQYLKGSEPGDPLLGYFFHILTRQGKNAPGGAYDYMIKGKLIAGFGLVAYPAKYDKTGVMTFIVNHQGKVYQKDQDGPFESISEYDPDESWTRVED